MIGLVVFVLALLQYSLEERRRFSTLVMTRVEAGFEKLFFNLYIRTPYFFIVVLYILFDVELVILFPLFLSNGGRFFVRVRVGFLVFIVVITLFLEWGATGLKWII